MLKKVIQLVILIVLLLFNTAFASALCMPTNISNDINRATAIFAGKVTHIEDREDDANSIIKATFSVSEVWRGPMNKILTVNIGNVGLWVEDMPTFELNQEYLVYAVGTDDNLSTYGCSSTKLLADAQADLTVLGQGQIINQNNNTNSTDYATSSTNGRSFFNQFNFSQGLLIVNTILTLIVILLLINKTKDGKLQ